MSEQFKPSGFSILPPVVKNLLIINGLFFLASVVLGDQLRINFSDLLGLHYPLSELFQPHQLVTYMFMHGSIMHLVSNMFALWMFGNSLENYWGAKRFLIYYMLTGIGAGLIQILVAHLRLSPLIDQVSPQDLNQIMNEGYSLLQSGRNWIGTAGEINSVINTGTVGASGSVFGILLAFGMLFPNTMIYISFIIPMKAKWFVVLYGAFELYSGFANNPGDNVAHFAHLGGMLFGFILIHYWRRK